MLNSVLFNMKELNQPNKTLDGQSDGIDHVVSLSQDKPGWKCPNTDKLNFISSALSTLWSFLVKPNQKDSESNILSMFE